jgi:hypothetical protein
VDKKVLIIIIAIAAIMILIPVVIVVGLVVVGLTMQVMPSTMNNYSPVQIVGEGNQTQFTNQISGIPITTAKVAWKAAEPIGIIDWTRNGDKLTIVVKNNTSDTIDVNSFSVKVGTTTDLPITRLSAAGTKIINISGIGDCSTGTKYAVPKSNISIEYTTTSGLLKTQKAPADIVGTC